MDWSQLVLMSPVGVVLGTALVVVFLDLILNREDRYVLPWLSIAGCVLAIVSTCQTHGELLNDRVAWFHQGTDAKSLIMGGAFCLDSFGMFIWGIAALSGALAILASPHRDPDSPLSTGEYYGLILLTVSGMMLLAVSHDFLTLLISLEIMSISTYILTGSDREDLRSNEGAIKYLVLGAFSTALFLMGVAFYYGAFGSFSLTPNARILPLFEAENPEANRQLFAILGMGLILAGALFKIGAAPFHFWVPDVYQGAPTGVTGLMAVGVKAAAFAVLARILIETFGSPAFREDWIVLLRWAAVLTMAIGNILAMRQSNVKRMLAYSGIAHTGYLLLALLIHDLNPAVAEEHLHGLVFYLLVYGVMTLGAFGVIGLLREDGRPLEEMDDYQGLAKEHPGIALCMAVFLFSLAGMPPLGGFFAKFMIFRGAIQQGEILAATLGILTSVASLYYYLRVIVQMYMSPSNATAPGEKTPAAARTQYAWSSNLLIYAAGAVTLALGLWPGWFY